MSTHDPRTYLSEKMRAIADRDQLAADHELRTKADEFDQATSGYFAETQIITPKFLGAWARARKAYCEYTGEELISQPD